MGKVIAYIRRSKDDESGLSFAAQLAVYRRDRLARDVYLSAWIDKEVQRRRARIVSASEDGTNGQDPASELLRHIVSAFAAYERALVGARTRAALAQKKRAGEKLGGALPPYGYRAGQDGRTLEPLPEEQRVIDRVRRWRSKDWSLRKIAERLTSDGILTKAGRPVWHPQQVSRLIKNTKAELHS